MKKILIVGSRGYVGSALYKHLSLRDDLTVHGLDSCLYNPSGQHTIVMDYKNMSEDLVKRYDVVILLAGHSSVKMCEGDFINSYNNNVNNFIELVKKLNESCKFIYASSSSVYGRIDHVANENDRDFIPYNNYDITKHIIDMCVDRFDIEYYGLRFGTVNGYSPLLRKDLMINSMYTSSIDNGEIKLYIKKIMRPILGMNDLLRGIEKIIDTNSDNRGLYNMCSFNKTAEDIAMGVSQIVNVPIKEYQVDQINNSKLQTVCYDFAIDSSKFEKTFNFEFTDTIETIVSGLMSDKFTTSDRSKEFKYE
jgi:UDP-glucose 4-epimerase